VVYAKPPFAPAIERGGKAVFPVLPAWKDWFQSAPAIERGGNLIIDGVMVIVREEPVGA